jgi:hypothetical protein
MRQTIIAFVMMAGACSSSGGHHVLGDGQTTGDGLMMHDARTLDATSSPHGFVEIGTSSSVGITIAVAEFTTTADPSTVLGSSGPCTAMTTVTASENDVSAGTVTLTGTPAPVTIMPTGTPPIVAYSKQLGDPPYLGGATITASAPGTADFPAFSLSAQAPSSPVGGFASPSSVSRAAGFTATWTAGTGPHMFLGVNSKVSQSSDATLRCVVPDAGSFTVTPAMLALLPSQDDNVNVSLSRGDLVTMTTPQVSLQVVTSASSGADVPFN